MSYKPQIKKIIRLPKPGVGQSKQVVKMTMMSTGAKNTSPKSTSPRISKQETKTLQQLEEDKLRAQLHEEIESRSRPCANRSYECTLQRLPDRDYCARHILADPSAPYKQCAFVHSGTIPGSTRKCHLPAPIVADAPNRRDSGLCFEHAHAALISRQRNAAPPLPPTTPSSKLQQLQHYVKPERPRTFSSASAVSVVSDNADQDSPETGTVVLDPFKQMDAATIMSSAATTLLDYRSDSDSETEALIGTITGPAGADEDSSGPEDTPFSEDPLMCAGVYTSEEVVRCTKDTLIALQNAYIGQMMHLRRKLKFSRKRYLAGLRREREVHCSIHNQITNGEPLTGSDLDQLKKLKAMTSFQKKFGVEAILARKLHEKRAKLAEGNRNFTNPSVLAARCAYTEGGVKCTIASLPQAKHCRKHILHDANQVLFTPCGDTRAGLWCQESLPPPPTSEARANHTAACVFHTDPPPYTVFTLRKDESDSSDSDEETRERSSEMGGEMGEMGEMGEVGGMGEVMEEVTIGGPEQSSSDAASDNVIVDCLVSQDSMNYGTE